MINSNTNSTECKKSFELFGDQWNLIIVDSLREKDLRFNEIQRLIGINSATLVNRLKKLEEFKLITRLEKTCDNQSVSYSLTELGKELLPIIDQILSFSAKI